jgi:hypothetical protein
MNMYKDFVQYDDNALETGSKAVAAASTMPPAQLQAPFAEPVAYESDLEDQEEEEDDKEQAKHVGRPNNGVYGIACIHTLSLSVHCVPHPTTSAMISE